MLGITEKRKNGNLYSKLVFYIIYLFFLFAVIVIIQNWTTLCDTWNLYHIM